MEHGPGKGDVRGSLNAYATLQENKTGFMDHFLRCGLVLFPGVADRHVLTSGYSLLLTVVIQLNV